MSEKLVIVTWRARKSNDGIPTLVGQADCPDCDNYFETVIYLMQPLDVQKESIGLSKAATNCCNPKFENISLLATNVPDFVDRSKN